VVNFSEQAQSNESAETKSAVASEVPPEKWQILESRWRAILGMETGIENLRLRMESLRAELEAAFKKPLTVEEKVHALNADVLQWTKAKGRVHFALPKIREFIHRANWALGIPERKKLEEILKNYIEPQIPFPELDKVPEQLENLLKDRQVLTAQGAAVHQEGVTVCADIQRALRTLQNNAANIKRNKMSEKREKGKFF
jgi:hypothetical protein